MTKSTLALGWGWRGKLCRSLVSKNTSKSVRQKPPRIEIVTNILGLPRLLHTWRSYLDHLHHKHVEWVYIVHKTVGCWWNLNGANLEHDESHLKKWGCTAMGSLKKYGQHLALLGDMLLHWRNVRIQNLYPSNTKNYIRRVHPNIII